VFCKLFSDTCRVAWCGDDLAGFVTSFIPPQHPESLFIWQVGVRQRYRGRGLGKLLIQDLLAAQTGKGVRFLEATVTPSNERSRQLFQSLAKKWDVPIREKPCFPEELFPDGAHEAEHLFRIGPLSANSRKGKNDADF